MKRAAFLVLALLLVSGAAFAADSGASLDVSASVGTEPRGGFGTGWGVDLGGNVDFNRIGIKVNLPENMKIQARASIGYYKWTDDGADPDRDYRRIPLDLGGRFVYTINPQLKAHGDLALEASFDKRDDFGGSETDTRVGLVPGAGITYYLNDQLTVGAEARMHVITDSYATFGVNVGFSLP